MTLEEFEGQMHRLSATFGDRHYAHERQLIFFDTLKYLKVRDLKRAVDWFIASAPHPPLLDKFTVYLKRELDEANRKNDPDKPLHDKLSEMAHAGKHCHRCHGSGLLDCLQIGDPMNYPTTFLCTCEFGQVAAQITTYRDIKIWDIYKGDKYVYKDFDLQKNGRYQEILEANLELRYGKVSSASGRGAQASPIDFKNKSPMDMIATLTNQKDMAQFGDVDQERIKEAKLKIAKLKEEIEE